MLIDLKGQLYLLGKKKKKAFHKVLETKAKLSTCKTRSLKIISTRYIKDTA